jgi:hypothetical protein
MKNKPRNGENVAENYHGSLTMKKISRGVRGGFISDG